MLEEVLFVLFPSLNAAAANALNPMFCAARLNLHLGTLAKETPHSRTGLQVTIRPRLPVQSRDRRMADVGEVEKRPRLISEIESRCSSVARSEVVVR